MPSVVAINTDVEQLLAQLAGINNYDAGTMTIDLVNTAGPTTTLHLSIHVDIDTIQLLTIISQSAQTVIDQLNAAPTTTDTPADAS